MAELTWVQFMNTVSEGLSLWASTPSEWPRYILTFAVSRAALLTSIIVEWTCQERLLLVTLILCSCFSFPGNQTGWDRKPTVSLVSVFKWSWDPSGGPGLLLRKRRHLYVTYCLLPKDIFSPKVWHPSSWCIMYFFPLFPSRLSLSRWHV